MNTNASVGKIARLPQFIREQLNQKLLDGIIGREILRWLNSLPEVTQVMAEHFAARPITHQNLSEWRRRGYQEWLEQKETQNLMFLLAEKFNGMEPADCLRHIGLLIVAELKAAVQQAHDLKDSDARWRRLQRICWEFARMQKIHAHGMSMQLQQEQALASSNFQLSPVV